MHLTVYEYIMYSYINIHYHSKVWGLKDRVKLKTGVIMLKIQLCHHRNKLHFKL